MIRINEVFLLLNTGRLALCELKVENLDYFVI